MSQYVVVVAPRVRAQLDKILAWWEEHRPEAPALVAAELKEAMGILAMSPTTGRFCPRTRTKGVRRVLLPRSRYHVYYRVLDEEQIIRVLSLWHASRGQAPRL